MTSKVLVRQSDPREGPGRHYPPVLYAYKPDDERLAPGYPHRAPGALFEILGPAQEFAGKGDRRREEGSGRSTTRLVHAGSEYRAFSDGSVRPA